MAHIALVCFEPKPEPKPDTGSVPKPANRWRHGVVVEIFGTVDVYSKLVNSVASVIEDRSRLIIMSANKSTIPTPHYWDIKIAVVWEHHRDGDGPASTMLVANDAAGASRCLLLMNQRQWRDYFIVQYTAVACSYSDPVAEQRKLDVYPITAGNLPRDTRKMIQGMIQWPSQGNTQGGVQGNNQANDMMDTGFGGGPNQGSMR